MTESGLSFSYLGGATYTTSYNSPGVRPTFGLRNSIADWDSDLYLYEASRNDLLSPYKDAFKFSPSPLLGFPSSQYSSLATSSPSTPLQAIFSSPGAIWTAINSSVSPVHRYGVRSLSRSARRKNSEDINEDFKASAKKIDSLLTYKASRERGPSLELESSVGSPSSLLSSALSSTSTSPCRQPSQDPPAVHADVYTQQSPVAVSTPRSAPKSKAMNSADRRAMREALGPRYNTRARRLARPASPLPAYSLPTRTSRKRPAQDLVLDRSPALPLRKKQKPAQASREEASTASQDASFEVPQRTFPSQTPIHPEFPLFYRRFAVVSYLEEHALK